LKLLADKLIIWVFLCKFLLLNTLMKIEILIDGFDGGRGSRNSDVSLVDMELLYRLGYLFII